MTADPQAPGAAAVYLNVEEIANNPMHYESFYARIKVLSEKGKDLATVQLPYFRGGTKIDDIKGRTIHADGTVIPLEGKPEDLLIEKSEGNEFGRKVFNLPSVEVGSILEYSYKIREDDRYIFSPQWEIQRPFYVHKAHYQFIPIEMFRPGVIPGDGDFGLDKHGDYINTLIWWPILPPGAEVKADTQKGFFTLDVANVPPLPEEEWSPPEDSYRYKVLFYYKSSRSTQEFWVTEARYWTKDVDHFAQPTQAIKDAANSIVSPGDSELDKAKKLYVAVQALDNTDFSRTKSESELKQLKKLSADKAEQIWAQKSGSPEELALLYLSLARAAGLNARAMKVADRQQRLFDATYLFPDQLTATLVMVNIDGKDLTLDPGEKMCPFGLVHWRHALAGGFMQSNEGKYAGMSPAQPYQENKSSRTGDIQLDAHGAVTGSFSILMTGQDALDWRQMSLRNDDAEVKKQFDRWLEDVVPQGVQAHTDYFSGMNDPDTPLIANVSVSGTLGALTGKRLVLPGFFFETREQEPFIHEEKRQTSVDMHFGRQVIEHITYHLPVGMSVEVAPKDDRISWPNHAILVTKSTQDAGQITVVRTLARAFTFAKPEEYVDLRSFYQKIAASDQQQMVLTNSAPASGNGALF